MVVNTAAVKSLLTVLSAYSNDPTVTTLLQQKLECGCCAQEKLHR